jgi:hypothetical protein
MSVGHLAFTGEVDIRVDGDRIHITIKSTSGAVPPPPLLPLPALFDAVEAVTGCTRTVLCGGSGSRILTDARQLLAVMAVDTMGWTQTRTAIALGNRDHSTIHNLVRVRPRPETWDYDWQRLKTALAQRALATALPEGASDA